MFNSITFRQKKKLLGVNLLSGKKCRWFADERCPMCSVLCVVENCNGTLISNPTFLVPIRNIRFGSYTWAGIVTFDTLVQNTVKLYFNNKVMQGCILTLSIIVFLENYGLFNS